MPQVHFVDGEGRTTTVEGESGRSLMMAATSHGVEGIEAACGGACSCATCHVYVGEEWLALLPPISELEDDMLEGTASERLPTSRLSCQIQLSAELDGMVVTVPEFQT